MFFLDAACERAMKYTIPAVRAAVSESLVKKHSISETDVAKRFGIAQAAVSKYLKKDYSERIKGLVKYIILHKMHEEVVKAFIERRDPQYIADLIDRVASSPKLVNSLN